MAKEEMLEMDGTVQEVLPNTQFRVALENGATPVRADSDHHSICSRAAVRGEDDRPGTGQKLRPTVRRLARSAVERGERRRCAAVRRDAEQRTSVSG